MHNFPDDAFSYDNDPRSPFCPEEIEEEYLGEDELDLSDIEEDLDIEDF